MCEPIPAVCLQCGTDLGASESRYCPTCHIALRRGGRFYALLPVPPVYRCRCGRKVGTRGALCPRCESLAWHAAHPVPVPWQPGRAA